MIMARIPQYINSWDGVLDWLRGKSSAAEILALSDGEHVEFKCTAPSEFPFASGSLSSPYVAFCVVPAEEVPEKILRTLKKHRGQEVDITNYLRAELFKDWGDFLNWFRERKSAGKILATLDGDNIKIEF